MDQRLEALADRLGLERGELVGLALALLGAVLAAVVALRVPLGLVGGDVPVDAPGGAPAASASPPEAAAVAPAGEVVVHVAGAVARPGVVTLDTGARVADAVRAAGGPSAEAVLDGLNLARVLVDGERVLVPIAGRAPVADAAEGAGGGAGTGVLPDGRVDLNAATAAQLEQLPGVGEVTAGRIVAFREEQGPFTDPAQLREVRGIGEARWLELRDLVGLR